MKIEMLFGEWVRETRKKKGLSARECARRAVVSPPVWSRWENDDLGRREKPFRPDVDTVEKIARALDVPVSKAMKAAYPIIELDTRTGEEKQVPEDLEEAIRETYVKANELFRLISPDQQ